MTPPLVRYVTKNTLVGRGLNKTYSFACAIHVVCKSMWFCTQHPLACEGLDIDLSVKPVSF